MKKYGFLLAGLLASLVFTAPAHAVIFGDITLAGSGGGQGITPPSPFEFRVFYVGGVEIFHESFSVGDAGSVVSITPADSFFSTAIAPLTNGIDETLRMEVTSGTGGGDAEGPESSYFGGSLFCLNGIDFAGQTITSLDLVIDTLRHESPGSDPNNDGNWTEFEYGARFVVNGEVPGGVVPEPATLLLFGSGLAGAGLRLKKRTR